jgi:lipopolysaccharide transport system permease protein
MLEGMPIVLAGVAYFAYLGDGDARVAALGVQEILPEPEHRSLALGLPLLMMPLLIVLQALFTVGLGYLLSALNLFLRDTYHLVGVGITVWMFATPIFYPPHLVETGNGGRFAWILEANPMHWLIDSYREVVLFASWPDAALLGRFTLAAVVTFALGATFFRGQKDRFPDLL